MSPAAVVAGEEYASAELENPSPKNFSTLGDEEVSAYKANRGVVRFAQADFFEKDWTRYGIPSKYDLIYDYTVS